MNRLIAYIIKDNDKFGVKYYYQNKPDAAKEYNKLKNANLILLKARGGGYTCQKLEK